MADAILSELDDICLFLQKQESIEKAAYAITGDSLTINIETLDENIPGIQQLAAYFEYRFEKNLNRPIKLQFKHNSASARPSATDKANEQPQIQPDTGSLESSNPVEQKLIGQNIYVFTTMDSDLRLLRAEPDRTKFDPDNYYQSSDQIVEAEIMNLNQFFQIASQDQKQKKFVKNIVELNASAAESSYSLSKYDFAFRQIPKPFAERFIFSLVRMPLDTSVEKVNELISSYRTILDTVYISIQLERYMKAQSKIVQFDFDGLVITAGNPQREGVREMLSNLNIENISKEILMLYYTKDAEHIPALDSRVKPMFLKSRISQA